MDTTAAEFWVHPHLASRPVECLFQTLTLSVAIRILQMQRSLNKFLTSENSETIIHQSGGYCQRSNSSLASLAPPKRSQSYANLNTASSTSKGGVQDSQLVSSKGSNTNSIATTPQSSRRGSVFSKMRFIECFISDLNWHDHQRWGTWKPISVVQSIRCPKQKSAGSHHGSLREVS